MFSTLRAMMDVTLFLQCLLVCPSCCSKTVYFSYTVWLCMNVFFFFCDSVLFGLQISLKRHFVCMLCVCVFPRRFGKIWGWINDDRILIFCLNYHFKTFYKHLVVWGSTLLNWLNNLSWPICWQIFFVCSCKWIMSEHDSPVFYKKHLFMSQCLRWLIALLLFSVRM